MTEKVGNRVHDVMASGGSCEICCENFNKSTRLKIRCNSCRMEVCKACASRYLLDTTLNAHCMGCKAGWDRAFLRQNLKPTFVNEEYAKYRGSLLFEREKALLVETMPVALLTKHNKEIELILVPMRREQSRLRNLRFEMYSKATRYICKDNVWLWRVDKDADKKVQDFDEKIKKLSVEMSIINKRKHRATRPNTNRTESSPAPPKYIRPCSADDCRGFISTAMKCTLCETKYCKSCHEVTGETHICKQEDVQSAAAILKDSKSCPNCHVLTYRVSGCPQMWCTLCHAVWNWTTCNIEKGAVHNPHYFEYMRRNGALPLLNNNPRGCEEAQNQLDATVERLKMGYRPMFAYQMVRIRNHVLYFDLVRYTVDIIQDNRDLRIKYLLNEIDEAWFKRLLTQREKQANKKKEYHQVLHMFSEVLLDLVTKFVTSETVTDALSVKSELKTLLKYTNESLEDIGKIYKCKHPSIEHDEELNRMDMTTV
jgi:hypothetical protein